MFHEIRETVFATGIFSPSRIFELFEALVSLFY